MSELQDNLRVILGQKQSYIIPENIKKDITVLGVTGTLEILDTSDADAVRTDIKTGKTAYVNGQKITGTLPEVLNPTSISGNTKGAFFKPDDAVGSSSSAYGCYTVTDTIGSHPGTSYVVNWVQVTSLQTWYMQNQQKVKVGMPYNTIASTIGLTASDIKKDVTILGVTGTYEGIIDTSDATATSEDIFEGQTAYADGEKLTGTLGTNVSTTFTDKNAQIYQKIQNAYDDMTPIVWTDLNKPLETDIYVIPVKSDGTPLLDTSAVTDMTSAFMGQTSLYSVPKIDTSNVTNMTNMFANCFNLKHIALLNTSNVTNMNFTFNSCDLETVPLFNTSNVTNMDYTFNSCNVVNMPVLDTSSVTTMSAIFGGCSHLSNNSLNNILQMCINAVNYTGTKTLKYIGLTSVQATTCQSLSNYQDFINAGWTTGY